MCLTIINQMMSFIESGPSFVFLPKHSLLISAKDMLVGEHSNPIHFLIHHISSPIDLLYTQNIL